MDYLDSIIVFTAICLIAVGILKMLDHERKENNRKKKEENNR